MVIILQRLILVSILASSGHLHAVEYTELPGVDCVINPNQVVDIASPVRGVIDQILVERSQQVTAGQALAQLDAKVERANVKLAKFRAGIQSEIQLGQINMSYDSKRQTRVNSLHKEKVLSDDSAEEAEREASLSRWRLEQARELADVRRLELLRAEAQLAQKTIRAPFDGYVLETYKYPGEYVEDQPILRLAQLDPLVVEAIVPMENFGQVRVGMQAEVVPDVITDDTLIAQVNQKDVADRKQHLKAVRASLEKEATDLIVRLNKMG